MKRFILFRFKFISVILPVALVLGLAFVSCDNGMTNNGTTGNGGEIPSDLRNTAWTRQISDSETITLSFGRDKMTMSSNRVSSQYNQQWDYRGGNCCGYGYCGFYNGPDSLDFRYTCNNNGLRITGSNMRSLVGDWARR